MSYPVQYLAPYEEKRDRLTVFFRLFMIIPHAIMAIFLTIALMVTVTIAWFAVVITGRYPEGLYTFHAGCVRWFGRLYAYAYLQTDAFPPFGLEDDANYPVRVLVDPPKPQYSRLKALFRIVLMIPVYIIAYAMTLVAQVIAFVVWIVAVITGSSPRGLHDVLDLCLGYTAKAFAYYSLITEDWPPFSNEAPANLAPPVAYAGGLPSAPADQGWAPPAPAQAPAGAPELRKEL